MQRKRLKETNRKWRMMRERKRVKVSWRDVELYSTRTKRKMERDTSRKREAR